MKTQLFSQSCTVKKQWWIVDVKNAVLGRVASRISTYLQGKHKPSYTPNFDTGDFIIVLNAKDVCLTGKKNVSKIYWRHTGYPGGIKKRSVSDMKRLNAADIIKLAVKRMMPKNKLSSVMLSKLRIYNHDLHPHHAQLPQNLDINKCKQLN